MKKPKSITSNEKFFRFTGTPVDGFHVGDILRLRQILNLNYDRYHWRIDRFSVEYADKQQNACFSDFSSTEYSPAGKTSVEDWNDALEWINNLYPGLEPIEVSHSMWSPLTIFGKHEDFDKINDEFTDMIKEFKKKHPEANIYVGFDWNWIA